MAPAGPAAQNQSTEQLQAMLEGDRQPLGRSHCRLASGGRPGAEHGHLDHGRSADSTAATTRPTLAQFQQYVHDGQVRYFLVNEGRGWGGGRDADSSGSQITEWVKANFDAQTVDGTTVYDLRG